MQGLNLQDPNVAAVARLACLRSLKFFTRFFFKAMFNRKFIINEHHDRLFSALELVLQGRLPRLNINMPPRYGKTEVAVKNFIGHGIALNSASKYIHLSYGDDIALDNSESVKSIIECPEFRILFPGVGVKNSSRSKEKWSTNMGGGLLARAAGGQVTGFGAGLVDDPDDLLGDAEMEELYNMMDLIGGAPEDLIGSVDALEEKLKFAGAIIIDDSIKPEDADQDRIREKVNSRFDSTIRNRANSLRTPIINIQHRLHPMDLSGYLQRKDEQDEWVTLSMPAIKEDGSPLWGFKHPIEKLKAMRKANELVFERQYMQNPQPKTGLMFPSQDLRHFNFAKLLKQLDEKPDKEYKGRPDYVYVPVDPANLGGDDFAAIAGWLVGSDIYVTDVLYNLLGADINEEETVKMIIRNKADAAGVEGVFGWEESAKRIREALQKRNWQNELRVLRPRTAKHVRISAKSSFIKNNCLFRDDWADLPQYAKFFRNVTSYKKVQEPGNMNKHDEGPDVLEMLCSYYERAFPELWELLG
jgi:hypothetical protein